MKKVVSPCVCSTYYGDAQAYAKIEYENGRLSICGVVGPKRNGDCKGSAGQCVDEIRAGRPGVDWNEEMLQKFCDIWDRWHLNDMHPYCGHQKTLGWDVMAKKEVTLYHYRLTAEALSQKKAAENAAIEALRHGKTFTPSDEQTMFATLKYSITSHEKLTRDFAGYYEPKKVMFVGDNGFAENKKLGFLRQEEHPDGLLCRPCPICGYKYGTQWKREEVPAEIIEWLFNLPNTKVEPALV